MTDTPKKTSGGLRWLWMVIPVLLVCLVGAAFWWIANKEKSDKEDGKSAEDNTPTLEIGKDYHVFVRVIEFYPTNSEDKNWDQQKDNAPDPFYRIYSEGAPIFESETLDDKFVAVMSPLGLDVNEAILKGKVTLSTVLQAATLHCDEDSKFEIEILDNDPITNDTALRHSLSMTDLVLGDNAYEFVKSEEIGVKRIVVRAIDADAPLAEQVKLLRNPDEE